MFAPILNRIATDAANIDIRHVRLDEEGRFKEEIDSGLNEALNAIESEELDALNNYIAFLNIKELADYEQCDESYKTYTKKQIIKTLLSDQFL